MRRTVVGDEVVVRQSDEVVLVLVIRTTAVGLALDLRLAICMNRQQSESLPLLVEEAKVNGSAVVHNISLGRLELVELRVEVVVNERAQLGGGDAGHENIGYEKKSVIAPSQRKTNKLTRILHPADSNVPVYKIVKFGPLDVGSARDIHDINMAVTGERVLLSPANTRVTR